MGGANAKVIEQRLTLMLDARDKKIKELQTSDDLFKVDIQSIKKSQGQIQTQFEKLEKKITELERETKKTRKFTPRATSPSPIKKPQPPVSVPQRAQSTPAPTNHPSQTPRRIDPAEIDLVLEDPQIKALREQFTVKLNKK